jgi:hypothetical protein
MQAGRPKQRDWSAANGRKMSRERTPGFIPLVRKQRRRMNEEREGRPGEHPAKSADFFWH